MTRKLDLGKVFRMATIFISIAFGGYIPAYSQEPTGGVLSTFELPFTIVDFKRQMEKTKIRTNVKLYVRDVERRKIAFLPTADLKKELAKTNTPKEILDALNFKNVAFFLQVSEFDCGGCSAGAKDGESFAEQVLDEIKGVTLKPSADNPLYQKSYLARLGPKGGVEQSDTPHVYILISGKLRREGRQEKVRVYLSYINAGYISKTDISSKEWTATPSSNRETIAKQIGGWVADSLKSAMN